MEANLPISIIIVNWNSGIQLQQCLESISKYHNNCVEKTIVVDNCSTDNSISCIGNYSDVEIVRSEVNLGFARACNLGAKRCASEFFLFLNPDTVLLPDTLRSSFDFIDSAAERRVAICGIRLFDEQRNISRSCARLPSGLSFFFHGVGIDRLFPRLGYHMHEWDHSETRVVDHVIGAYFLVRKIAFNELGGFNEDYFLYLEDLDFSFRARAAGWKTIYFAGASAFHAGGGTSRQIKALRLFYSLRSRLIYAKKYLSAMGKVSTFFVTLSIEPIIRTFRAAILLSPRTMLETWQAYLMLFKWIIEPLGSRK